MYSIVLYYISPLLMYPSMWSYTKRRSNSYHVQEDERYSIHAGCWFVGERLRVWYDLTVSVSSSLRSSLGHTQSACPITEERDYVSTITRYRVAHPLLTLCWIT